jgi:hypothetical protein
MTVVLLTALCVGETLFCILTAYSPHCGNDIDKYIHSVFYMVVLCNAAILVPVCVSDVVFSMMMSLALLKYSTSSAIHMCSTTWYWYIIVDDDEHFLFCVIVIVEADTSDMTGSDKLWLFVTLFY